MTRDLSTSRQNVGGDRCASREGNRATHDGNDCVETLSKMALSPAELIAIDREHLIHPLHHPIDHSDPVVYVRGHGAVVEDIDGNKYLDGLSGLWNVNVGH